ncbi:phage tail protein [Microvirga sp. SRT04]|uniref:Phage tail protein n=2 Tax=Hymenobacter properus TaxID=2791026 RepID=A0A931BCQ5_9BACT|nr:phage tail protein [Hymenobacter properus]MBR7719693.1 phage tail protein [Microvirga sp. SRT04]
MGGSPYVGEIQIFPFDFAPRGWAQCNGQLLPIAQNAALFSLLGTMYGGDGRTTFALPDMRGRVPVGSGTSPTSGSSYYVGLAGGREGATLSVNSLPAHNHGYQVSNATATSNAPNGTLAAVVPPSVDLNGAPVNILAYAPNPSGLAEDGRAIQPAGGSQPFSVLAPYQTLNFCIALQGVYPSRN